MIYHEGARRVFYHFMIEMEFATRNSLGRIFLFSLMITFPIVSCSVMFVVLFLTEM
jgi:hypothetical protein